MNIKVGNKITWSSAAGQLKGDVTSIVLALNAANQTIPWMDVKEITDSAGKRLSGTRLCATDNNLKMLKVELV
jgi:hypothetical protein